MMTAHFGGTHLPAPARFQRVLRVLTGYALIVLIAAATAAVTSFGGF